MLVTGNMILDALDGYWARNMSKPTTEGQFLDQFIDKWGFVYPIFFALSGEYFAPSATSRTTRIRTEVLDRRVRVRSSAGMAVIPGSSSTSASAGTARPAR